MKKIFLLALLSICVFATNAFSKEVSAYLIGEYIDSSEAKTRLQNIGYEVLSIYEPVKNASTIIFTNVALKKEASKKGRAHAAVLRLFIDTQNRRISFTNPLYFGKAFMQDDYNDGVYQSQYDTINKEFKGLKGSKDKLNGEDIAGFHFMIGMPYYEDFDELGKGSNAALITKAKAYKKGKLFLFELKLSETSTLIGYDLGKRTKKFVKKIGRANGAVLPYCISIEDGKATSLEAKYYLAISYPLLTMTEFTTIATVPGAIKKDLSKPFH